MFTWMKDGDPTVLQSTDITLVEHTSTSAVFRIDYTISNFSISDSGTYTCTVTNPIGSNSTTITVNLRKLLCVVTIQCKSAPLQKVCPVEFNLSLMSS